MYRLLRYPISCGVPHSAERRACLFHSHRRYADSPPLTTEERQHLSQELPPRELLTSLRSGDRYPGDDAKDITVPGDSFGIMHNRVAFYKPAPRPLLGGPLGEQMPPDTHPLACTNPRTIQLLCGRYNVSPADAVRAMAESEGNINEATYLLEKRFNIRTTFGSYGVVAMESYAPETFCLVSYNLPNYEAIGDDDVLEAIHELTLSAAEMPLDTDRRDLREKFMSDWTTEDGTPCHKVLKEYDITVKEVMMLPYGEYSVQGFHVLHAVKDDSPNIGVGAAACCLDLRTGIHNRFRFHVERVADSISEHVMRERVHYDQGIHLYRQPYWFHTEYSVEEFLRFKESLLQPSAAVFEMRYACAYAPAYGLEGFRTMIESEKLKIAQHKYEKHYEEFTAPGKWMTADNAQLQTVSAAAGGSTTPGSCLHHMTNDANSVRNAMETRTGPLRKTLESSVQAHGDRVLARFYRNNYH